MSETVYLSRRNLLTLLSKLDRVQAGEQSSCTIIKQDVLHPTYRCSTRITVIAVEDEAYYNDRSPGAVHPKDEPFGESWVRGKIEESERGFGRKS